jgi:hypothetical protein
MAVLPALLKPPPPPPDPPSFSDGTPVVDVCWCAVVVGGGVLMGSGVLVRVTITVTGGAVSPSDVLGVTVITVGSAVDGIEVDVVNGGVEDGGIVDDGSSEVLVDGSSEEVVGGSKDEEVGSNEVVGSSGNEELDVWTVGDGVSAGKLDDGSVGSEIDGVGVGVGSFISVLVELLAMLTTRRSNVNDRGRLYIEGSVRAYFRVVNVIFGTASH